MTGNTSSSAGNSGLFSSTSQIYKTMFRYHLVSQSSYLRNNHQVIQHFLGTPRNMQISIVLVVLCIAIAATVAFPHHEPGHQIPHTTEETAHRVARSPGDDKKGHVHAGVHEESGKGVVADVNGKGTVYESKDGKSRVNVEGSWSKVLDGPQRGKPQHSAGVSVDFDF